MLRRLLNQCTLDVRLETREPLLVRSGSSTLSGPDMAFVRTARHGRLQPFIPGSSLKGVLRSHAERIARTLKPHTVCDVFEYDAASGRQNGCSWVLTEKKKDRRDQNGTPNPAQAPSETELYGRQCPACRLFGSLAWKGRFHPGDAYLVGGIARANGAVPNDQTQPELRDGVGIDRVTGGVAGGALFDLEVVPAGTTFHTTLDIVNFELWQLGWLAYVLRDLGEGYVRVGGGTSRGLGRVEGRIDRMKLSYIGAPALLETSIPGMAALLGRDETARYGMDPENDRIALPDGISFARPPAALRSQYQCESHDRALTLLGAFAPVWDAFIASHADLPTHRQAHDAA